MNIVGHHHISMYTKDAKINKDFYTNILGLRLVEVSVNQDSPTMYHLFYGDEIGSAGTLLTFFEIRDAGHKRKGTESIYRLSLLVPDAEALQYYESRLHKNSIKTKRLNYLGQEAIAFKDVDDLEVLLIANDDYEIPHKWKANTYSDIPEQYQILGLGPVELRVRDAKRTIEFLENILGYQMKKGFEHSVMTIAPQGLYSDFVVVEQQGERERPGRGYIHHIAVNTPKLSDLNAIYKKLQLQPQNNSGIIDRYFFKSLYYRHNSIMYEFATEEPGFTVDTSVENLGNKLNLPDFLEEKREQIERKLDER
ncbi:TPA: VOC family protein [Staphylococcus argenteus]